MLKALPAGFAALFAMTAAHAAMPADEERKFDLPAFDRIDVSTGVTVIADIGEAQTITVKTDNGDFTDFEIGVRNGELHISRNASPLRWHASKADYKVLITAPSLKAIDASSGSHAKITNISTPNFFIDLSSGAHATLDGECEECVIDLSSGANLNAKYLECEAANIDVSSGGHGVIRVLGSVTADASSGGHVAIVGNPERINVDKSSGGQIKLISTAQANND